MRYINRLFTYFLLTQAGSRAEPQASKAGSGFEAWASEAGSKAEPQASKAGSGFEARTSEAGSRAQLWVS